jgi:hypothetical protein
MQIQQGLDLTFADGVRALMRQDPDIIMVGEIRDLETAEMAIQAASQATWFSTLTPTTPSPLRALGLECPPICSTDSAWRWATSARPVPALQDQPRSARRPAGTAAWKAADLRSCRDRLPECMTGYRGVPASVKCWFQRGNEKAGGRDADLAGTGAGRMRA